MNLLKILSYKMQSHRFPKSVNARGLFLILLLGGDIAVNPGPAMGVVNVRSIRNKGVVISDNIASHNIDLLCLTETHIRTSDTDSLLKSVTPVNHVFLQRPRVTGLGGGVGFIINNNLSPKSLDSPGYHTFENMVTSVLGSGLTVACVYRPPGPCTVTFMEDFMSFVGFLSSVDTRFCILGDFNMHVDVPEGVGAKFISILESCNLDQHVTQPTHLHGHTLDLILSPSDQSVVDNVKVCGFISDHALIKCSVALPTPPSKPVNIVSYRRYHRIDMNTFRSELKDVPFVQSPASSVSELYNQYVQVPF